MGVNNNLVWGGMKYCVNIFDWEHSEESLIKSGLRQMAFYLTGSAKYSKWYIRDRIVFDRVRRYHKAVLNTFIKSSKFRLIVGAHRMYLLKI